MDEDFSGLWKYEDNQNPLCAKSRAGYVMPLGRCILHWVSKLQKEIAPSTLEAKYISLYKYMYDLLPLR